MKNVYKSEQTGRSMVEMLGVLAIIGVLSVGGIAGYSQAMSKFKVSKTMDQIQTIITNIRTIFASQRSYGTLTTAQAYSLGILTDETYADAKGVNPYGGEIKIGTGTNNRSFTIEYASLPADACIKLATADWGGDASSGLVAISLKSGASAVKFEWASQANVDAEENNILPISLTKAITGCGVGAANSAVVWEYR